MSKRELIEAIRELDGICLVQIEDDAELATAIEELGLCDGGEDGK